MPAAKKAPEKSEAESEVTEVTEAPEKSGSTQFKVVAPLVSIKDRRGDIRHLYAGDVVPEGTQQESIDHLLDLGYIESEK